MLILHYIGFIMGLGTGFAHAFLAPILSKMDKEEATKFKLRLIGLSRMGAVGMVFLIGSGAYLIIPYWSALPHLPLLILKLVLVLILIIMILFLDLGTPKALKRNDVKKLKKLEILGKFTLLTGVLIIVVAVFVFH